MELSLPAETLFRRPPLGLVPGEEGLFQHEFTHELAAVVPQTLDVDFLPQGLLVHPGSSRLRSEGFQNGVPRGLAGVKARVRAWHARWQYPRVAYSPSGSRQPLVVTDEFSNGYFHWVGDVLPKLAWLADKLDHYELILPAYAHRFRYMEESLALWPHLRWRVAPAEGRLSLSGALVVPALAITGNYRPRLMQTLGESWRRFVRPSTPSRRVYVSRAKAAWRKIHNEDAVWGSLASLGFERVFLEDLAMADQVKLAAESAVLVSNHGAGLTALAFMVPGTRVLEIRLAGDAHNNCYYALADALGLEYTYVTAPPASRNRDAHTADLVVDVPALLRTLEVSP